MLPPWGNSLMAKHLFVTGYEGSNPSFSTNGELVKWDNIAFAWQNWGFDSLIFHHFYYGKSRCVDRRVNESGSNPDIALKVEQGWDIGGSIPSLAQNAELAQWLVQSPCKRKVGSSNLSFGTEERLPPKSQEVV